MTEQVTEPAIRYQSCIDEITALIKARAPIIWVVTHEEQRFMEDFEANVAKKLKRGLWTWSAWQGLLKKTSTEVTGQAQGEEKGTNNPQKALQRIVQLDAKNSEKGICFLLKDFHTVLVEPVPRQIRDMYEHLTGTAKTLIVVSPVMAHGAGGKERGLPPTLEKQICVVEYGLPNFNTIRARILNILEQMNMTTQNNTSSKYKLEYSPQELTDFAKAVQGLTLLEIETAVATSLTHLHQLSVDKLIQDKRQIIRKSQILEFIDEPIGMGDVGGLDQAKFYLNKYAQANTEEAQAFGVEPLKGILLTGVPGTGKSLLAKAIGKLWKTPLLRLDVGKVMTGLVGGSESKMREVIQQAESMAPCVTGDAEVMLANGQTIPVRQLHAELTRKCELRNGGIIIPSGPVDLVTIDPETGARVISKCHTVLRKSVGQKKLLRITTESGKQITVTENHKLLCQNESGKQYWKQAKDLTEEDDLVELDNV